MALFLLAAALRSDAGCDAQFTLADTTTLPGMPVRAFITLTNDSEAPRPAPPSVAVLVRAGAGRPFFFDFGNGHATNLRRRHDTPLAAHETRVVSFGYDAAVFAGNFTSDRSFWTPGDYSLRLVFFDQPGIYQSIDSASYAPAPDMNEALARASCLSNEAVLQVLEPSGVDAKLWKELRRLAPHGSEIMNWRKVHVEPLFEEFPGSQYLPFLLRWYPTPSRAQRIALYERTLALPMHDSARDRLLYEIANEHQTIAASEYRDQPGSASQHADISGKIYRDLLTRTKDPVLRRLTQEKMDNAFTREWIAEQRQQH